MYASDLCNEVIYTKNKHKQAKSWRWDS